MHIYMYNPKLCPQAIRAAPPRFSLLFRPGGEHLFEPLLTRFNWNFSGLYWSFVTLQSVPAPCT